jgi:tetratricopeptide (TPR) repeat protein
MNVKSILFLCLIAGAFFFQPAQAQSGWNWPEDKQTATTKNALYTDALRAENFRAAADNLHWLLVNAPDLNSSIYINGAKIYEGLASKEKDAKQKIVYMDSALVMYDLRIKYFNEEADVVNRKAYEAYKFYRDNSSKYAEMLEMFQKAFELNGDNVMNVNTIAYMDVIRRAKLSGGSMTDDEILEKYDQISTVIDNKMAAADEKTMASLQGYKDKIDAMLVEVVTVDCAFIENKLGQQLAANPEDVKVAKKIITLSLAAKCTDSPIFMEAATVVHKVEPNYSIAIVIAKRAKIDGKFDVSAKYFEEALKLTDKNSDKADIYLELADLAFRRGQNSTARDYALRAVSTDGSKTDAYTFIGDLYFRSFDQCKGGENIVHDRAVFLAAYEMYRRGGDTARMANAKAQFPSAEEIFTYNMEVGQQIKVGCWINETVTIQRR